MTPEQAKTLQPGDKLLVEASYLSTYACGDIKFALTAGDPGETPDGYASPATIHLVSGESPQPRPFRKGDTVRPCSCNGRAAWGYTPSSSRIKPDPDRTYKVFADELRSEVTIAYQHGFLTLPACHLELVTPVQDLAPYVVQRVNDQFEVRKHHREEHVTMAIFNIAAYADATAAERAAKAERDRLNAQHKNS